MEHVDALEVLDCVGEFSWGVESYADVQGGMVCFGMLCSGLVKSEEDEQREKIYSNMLNFCTELNNSLSVRTGSWRRNYG